MARDADRNPEALALAPAGVVVPDATLKLSPSLARANRDEFVFVGRHGQVLSPARYRVQRAAALGLAGVAALGGVAFSIIVGAPWLALLYVASLVYGGNVWRRSEQLKRGAALLAADRLEEAEQTLLPLTRAPLVTQTVRALAWQNLAGISLRRGEPELALAQVRRCQQLFRAIWWAPLGPWRWINRFSEVQILAQLGRVEEGRKIYAEMRSAPSGEYFALLRMNAELMLAFAEGDPSSLPDDLHPWVTTALSTTSAELALAVLGWAYERRGEPDMAVHLVEQALDRIDPSLFARTFPRVWAWIQRRSR